MSEPICTCEGVSGSGSVPCCQLPNALVDLGQLRIRLFLRETVEEEVDIRGSIDLDLVSLPGRCVVATVRGCFDSNSLRLRRRGSRVRPAVVAPGLVCWGRRSRWYHVCQPNPETAPPTSPAPAHVVGAEPRFPLGSVERFSFLLFWAQRQARKGSAPCRACVMGRW